MTLANASVSDTNISVMPVGMLAKLEQSEELYQVIEPPAVSGGMFVGKKKIMFVYTFPAESVHPSEGKLIVGALIVKVATEEIELPSVRAK